MEEDNNMDLEVDIHILEVPLDKPEHTPDISGPKPLQPHSSHVPADFLLIPLLGQLLPA